MGNQTRGQGGARTPPSFYEKKKNLFGNSIELNCPKKQKILISFEIRNTAGKIKEIIKFFRESVLCRKLLSHIPIFCATRCSNKYTLTRVFERKLFEYRRKSA